MIAAASTDENLMNFSLESIMIRDDVSFHIASSLFFALYLLKYVLSKVYECFITSISWLLEPSRCTNTPIQVVRERRGVLVLIRRQGLVLISIRWVDFLLVDLTNRLNQMIFKGCRDGTESYSRLIDRVFCEFRMVRVAKT